MWDLRHGPSLPVTGIALPSSDCMQTMSDLPLLGLFFDPEGGGDAFLRNVRLSRTDTCELFHRLVWNVSTLCPHVTGHWAVTLMADSQLTIQTHDPHRPAVVRCSLAQRDNLMRGALVTLHISRLYLSLLTEYRVRSFIVCIQLSRHCDRTTSLTTRESEFDSRQGKTSLLYSVKSGSCLVGSAGCYHGSKATGA
jgi:hypothetical protein